MFPLIDVGVTRGALVYLDKLNAGGSADSLCSDTCVEARWILVQNGDFESVVQRHSLIVDGQICAPTAQHCVLSINALVS